MVDDVNPAQKRMNQCPQDTVVDAPAEESGEHGTNAPKDSTPAATAPLCVFFDHGNPPRHQLRRTEYRVPMREVSIQPLAGTSHRVSTADGESRRPAVLVANRAPRRSATTTASPNSQQTQRILALPVIRHRPEDWHPAAFVSGCALNIAYLESWILEPTRSLWLDQSLAVLRLVKVSGRGRPTPFAPSQG